MRWPTRILELPRVRFAPREWTAVDIAFLATASAATWMAYVGASGSRSMVTVATLATCAGLAMHARLALGRTAAVLLTVVSVAGLVLLGAGAVLAGAAATSALTGIAAVRRFGGRPTLLRLAVAIGLAAAVASYAGVALMPGRAASWADIVAAWMGGFVGVLLLPAVDPLFEGVFGHSTRLTLGEWLSFEHPLLRELARVAPGTLQHSVNVGVLASSAAQAVRADALLVRVAALYHDVGKASGPVYFIENQDGPNPHDTLPPLESVRLVAAHVPDGVTRVLDHGMGQRMADFVREHHGTSVMRGFLEKARSQAGRDAVDPAAFRYGGPRPRSRETGILMIADQVEATARSAPPPDRAACEAVVHRTVARIVDEGELDDSGLSDRDLERLQAAMARSLLAMYHRRPTYPGQILPAPGAGAAGRAIDSGAAPGR